MERRATSGDEAPDVPDRLQADAVGASYAQLPLSFEPNYGQAGPAVTFLARTANHSTVLLSPTEAELRTNDHRVRMSLLGADPGAGSTGEEALPGISNYLMGPDPSAWTTNIPTFARVTSRQVYPGVDLAWYGNGRALEYDFIVGAGAGVDQIRISFPGSESISVDEAGDLLITTGGVVQRQHKPVLFQTVDGKRTPVDGHYVLDGATTGFAVGRYDALIPLVIDPVLEFSSMLGGQGGEFSGGIALDSAGNAYISGGTNSGAWDSPPFSFPPSFPNTTPLQTGQPTPASPTMDVFVSKLNPAGTALVYSTYWGGTGAEQGSDIAVDALGSAYVVGYTDSSNFPLVNSVQPNAGGNFDAFVSKLNPSGTALVFSTYLGGTGAEDGRGIAVDSQQRAYVTGVTESAGFPAVNALQAALHGPSDAFVTRFSASGGAIDFSTYLGGGNDEDAYGIAVDGTGQVYLTGHTGSTDFPTANALQPSIGGYEDAFLSKLAPGGASLVYSTYLGGTDFDRGSAVAVDGQGNVYLTGNTHSTNFPVVNALQPTHGAFQGGDVFVTKVNATGTNLEYSTFLGGSGDDGEVGYGGIAVDSSGAVYVTSTTRSADFPVADPFQASFAGSSDAIVAKLDPAGTGLVYSSFLGAAGFDVGHDIAVNSAGKAYVTGFTEGFPPLNPVQAAQGGGDVFVARIGIGVGVLTGNPLAWGYNYSGQVGDGTTSDRLVPVNVSGAHTLTAIAGGGYHSMGLRSNGSVIAWGNNAHGQLGNNTTTSSATPVQVSGLTSGVLAVAGGDNHSLAIKGDHTVVAWGNNLEGELGNNSAPTDSAVPVTVTGLANVTAVAAGVNHNLALRSDGSVVSWGWNGNGQLGNNTTTDSAVPVQVSGLTSGVVAIGAGAFHSLALKSDGSVVAWGYNSNGQLGDNTGTDRLVPVPVVGLATSSATVTAVAGGGYHSLALKSDGSVVAWGMNANGALGHNFPTSSPVPVPVDTLSSGVTAIAGGYYHNLALKSGGSVVAWGRGLEGQLGNNGTATSSVPVPVTGLSSGVVRIEAGATHSLAIGSPVPLAPQSITFVGPGTGIKGASAALSATGGGSGNPVVFSVHSTSGAGVCNVSGPNGATVHYTAVGTCVIAANQAGNGTYSAAPQVTQAIVVSPPSQSTTVADFDGDDDSDISVFRPSDNTWYVRNGATVPFGLTGDVPVSCDYDGNGTADVAVFRPSAGAWYIQNQATVFLGATGDVPVPGDYDGDGDCDPAVFRPSVGGWYRSGAATVFHGLSTDIPVPADYDGDGTTDITVFRPSAGGWYRVGATTTFYGLNTDIPVPADYDGNGSADVAVFRPSAGGWYVSGQSTQFLGLNNDIPVPGDYDGDGSADRAVFRPSGGAWYVGSQPPVFFGLNGDRPLPLPSAVRQVYFP